MRVSLSKEIKLVYLKGNQPLKVLVLKLKFQYFGYLMQRTDSLENLLMLGKTEKEKRMAEGEMVR